MPIEPKIPTSTPLPPQTREMCVRKAIAAIDHDLEQAWQYARTILPSHVQIVNRLSNIQIQMKMLKDSIAFPIETPKRRKDDPK